MRRESRTLGSFALLSLVPCASGAPVLPQEAQASKVEISAPAPRIRQALAVGSHARLRFDEDVVRVAVGRPQTLSVEIVNSRELLALGLEPGQTSVFVWFDDDRTESLLVTVQPDYSLLQDALVDIHGSISVEVAPDRDAVVLRGLVPDITYRLAAEAAASAYLDARSRRGSGTALVSPELEGVTDGDAAAPEARSAEIRPAGAPTASQVINLIQVESLPPRADEKIREALLPLVGDSVEVRRVLVGDLPDDGTDLFVLEGTVPDQVTLSRTLFLASRALLGEAADVSDIKVLADEGGALTDVSDLFGAAQLGGGSSQTSLLASNQESSGPNNQTLANRIGSNLGRAKVVEAASGRILSMIEVEHLPLVRIDVRLYEVNLTRLQQWSNDLAVIGSDFDQGPLLPSGVAQGFQGANAAAVGQDDIQNVLGFLGGELGGQTQLVSGGLAVENLFTLLVNEQVARALSRPTITVLSGELALFQVGGQIPISVAVTVGGGTDQVLNGVEFRDFGVQLSVRPLVEELDSETITLDLQPVVSLPDLDLTSAIGTAIGGSLGSTAFETRGTRTHTRLRDGDAMLVGGLISRRETTGQAKTPILGDVPLAGWLFRNETTNADDLELVIVVNPVIVRPERPDARLWAFGAPGSVLEECFLDARRSARRRTE